MTYDGAEVRAQWRPWWARYAGCATLFGPVQGLIAPAATAWAGRGVLPDAPMRAAEYLNALELLASLRLCCSNVARAVGGADRARGATQSIRELIAPGGTAARLARPRSSRRCRGKPLFSGSPLPGGAMYAFVGRGQRGTPAGFSTISNSRSTCSSRSTCWVAPGVSFQTCRTAIHFRITNLPRWRPRCGMSSGASKGAAERLRPPGGARGSRGARGHGEVTLVECDLSALQVTYLKRP